MVIKIKIGLSSTDLFKLSKYMHFRQPCSKDKLDMIVTGEAIFKYNFMDSLNEDKLKGNFLIIKIHGVFK